jgi:hypothetical protein
MRLSTEQSFLRRLSWWKIDNVKNAIEFEHCGDRISEVLDYVFLGKRRFALR